MKKEKLLIKSFIICLIGFTIFSCGKDEATNLTTDKFTFLKVGRSWRYTEFDSTGIFIMDLTFIAQESLGNGNFQMLDCEIFHPAGIWHMTDNSFGYRDTITEIIVKANAKLNDIIYNISGSDTISSFKVVGINIQKQVPAGTYPCYKVEMQKPLNFGTYYINKDFGIICFSHANGNNTVLISKSF